MIDGNGIQVSPNTITLLQAWRYYTTFNLPNPDHEAERLNGLIVEWMEQSWERANTLLKFTWVSCAAGAYIEQLNERLIEGWRIQSTDNNHPLSPLVNEVSVFYYGY